MSLEVDMIKIVRSNNHAQDNNNRIVNSNMVNIVVHINKMGGRKVRDRDMGILIVRKEERPLLHLHHWARR